MNIVATKESRTKNYQENLLVEFEAVTHILNLLFKTPKGALPYTLGLGFDLRSLIFKVSGTDEYERSVNDLREQIRHVTGNEDIIVSINKVKSNVEVVINVKVSNKHSITAYIPIDNGDIKYKDIIVK